MSYDYTAKGAADFAANSKDERLFHNTLDHGRLYREGWHAARRAAELEDRLSGFEHAGQTPVTKLYEETRGSETQREANGTSGQASEVGGGSAAPRPLFDETRRPDRAESSKPPYRVPLMSEIAARPKNGFKAVSTFSGCGGSSLGYKMAGFDLLWASEFIPAAQETYRANHPGTILDTRDIREVKPEDILAATGLARGEIDLFDGSPPCASFSTAGIREEGWGRVKKYSDTKQRTDDLFFEFARLVEGTQPKVFVAENVAGLTVGVAADQMLGEGQLDAFETQEDTILHTLMDCGYRVGFHVLNAADLGVPQSRRRVIFVGIRKDLAAALNLEPVWPRALPYRYTVRDAIPWITSLRVRKQFEAGVPREEQKIGALSERSTDEPAPTINAGGIGFGNLSQYEVEAETDITRFAIGREWDNLKPGEQSEKYFSLIKVHPDEPCPCVCASHGSGGIASITHPTEKRKFSIVELKRLCGFPDDFILTGTYQQQWERLGRAVPPVMMAAVAATIRDELLERIRAAAPAPVAPPAPVIPEPEPLPPPVAPTPVVVPAGQLELFA